MADHVDELIVVGRARQDERAGELLRGVRRRTDLDDRDVDRVLVLGDVHHFERRAGERLPGSALIEGEIDADVEVGLELCRRSLRRARGARGA